jgi:hypothetical protein
VRDSIILDDQGKVMLDYYMLDGYQMGVNFTNNAIIGVNTLSKPGNPSSISLRSWSNNKLHAGRGAANIDTDVSRFPMPTHCPEFELNP